MTGTEMSPRKAPQKNPRWATRDHQKEFSCEVDSDFDDVYGDVIEETTVIAETTAKISSDGVDGSVGYSYEVETRFEKIAREVHTQADTQKKK